MIKLERARQLIDCGLSLIPIGENKIPLIAWKQYQTAPMSKDEFTTHYNNPKIKGVGICTGYNGLECIDIDLKVLPSLKDQHDFWQEYTSFIRDNIEDFDNKFVIFKTINNGYHIIYRCATVGGNQKLAKLEGQKEAIIETRGEKGYIFVYENQVSKRDYTEIQEISELDREVLMEISRSYNFDVPKEEIIHTKTEYTEVAVKVWDDYNAKASIHDILKEDFEIVRNLKDKYVIKRFGATSSHSGYVFKSNNCMYLFSTGTLYPHEKLLSAFSCYTHKYHNGDFKASTKDLYHKGYGSRIVKKPKELKEVTKINTNDLIFPIDIYPESIQSYMMLCNTTLDSSIDYMGCSLLWLTSVIIGNSMHVQVKSGWVENCTMWLAIVGRAGLGKTPSINNIIFPLMKANNREIKNFIKQNDKYQAFRDLDKKEQKLTEEIKKPVKSQFIVNDITLEALVDLHEESDNAIGVFKDELAGWFKDMNKYRAGSDLEFWLSSWSGKSVSLNRKSAKSAFVEKPLIPVLGGIQPSILNIFYTEENKDNGFIDRMLLSYPDLEVESYNEKEIPEEVLEWYSSSIISFFDFIKQKAIRRNIEQEIEPNIIQLSDEARTQWKRIFNEITAIQNSKEENEYMKSMLPKQKAYIPRFALLINTINNYYNQADDYSYISEESILKAEKLSKYFIAMAKKIKINTVEVNELRQVMKVNATLTNREKFAKMYEANPDLNIREAANLLGLSHTSIYNYIKEINGSKTVST